MVRVLHLCEYPIGWGKFSDLQFSECWKMQLKPLTPLARSNLWSPHAEQPPIDLSYKVCTPHEKLFLIKSPPIL